MKGRMCIGPKDIMILTGKSERYGREVIRQIRLARNKAAHQPVTIEEFCIHMGLKEKKVRKHLNLDLNPIEKFRYELVAYLLALIVRTRRLCRLLKAPLVASRRRSWRRQQAAATKLRAPLPQA